MEHVIVRPNLIIHYSTTDAVFRTLDGRPIAMEYHNHLGPMFTLDHGDDGFSYMPKEDSNEWRNLWQQFDGWLKDKRTRQ